MKFLQGSSMAGRTLESLDAAVAQAMDTIRASDARAWFSHCGYRFASE